MSKPVVVIVPAYNVEDYIDDCLDSLKQPEVGWIIVADDGSTDDTIKRAAAHQNTDYSDPPSITICQATDGRHNQYHAKNRALALAFRGTLLEAPWHPNYHPFIGFLDADDIAAPDRFARQVAALEKDENLVAVGGHCRNIKEDGSFESDAETAWPLDEDPLLKGKRQFGIGLWNATALYRREVFSWLGSFDYTASMGDSEFFTRLVWAATLRDKKLCNLRAPAAVLRRIRPAQVSDPKTGHAATIQKTAYQRLLEAKFNYYRALHQAGLLQERHLYRPNDERH